ncbi:DNA polymerase III epsilon subunit [Tepidamorphus gemmatus]|uniref:DNA polymerase III subunit epsilon n=1 Tax=Tepidamorphus gemmatus TaxID=747076 RepID=A0A4R3MFN2_9HYPH|nr:DNA polymerase III subunit epsilon [Tepidamorphus gemmatus]TCT11903.1 DNA polymerase III epsilon subunit [Tepidamorphus gemmatus]
MREIVLDTETTGLDPRNGDRIVEIGGVELLNHIPTGRTIHLYINPERDMPAEAFAVHGLSTEFLADKPRFADVAATLLDFIADARLVIHNASFDLAFLNAELSRCGLPPIPFERAVDTLMLARRRNPGAPNSLDALCQRYGIDNSRREKHGALLDSELLAEVYIELLGGRQARLELVETEQAGAMAAAMVRPRPQPLPPRITAAEIEAHAAFVSSLGGEAIWLRYRTADLKPEGGGDL